MLYPKEDRLNNTLMFACRTCQFSEPASSSCVFRNHLYNTVGETAGVTQDVGTDPTVCIPGCCLHCGQVITCYFCGASACLQFRGRLMRSEMKNVSLEEKKFFEVEECYIAKKDEVEEFVERAGEEHMEQPASHSTPDHSMIMG